MKRQERFDEAIVMNALPYAYNIASNADSMEMLKTLAIAAASKSKFKLAQECQIRISGTVSEIFKLKQTCLSF